MVSQNRVQPPPLLSWCVFLLTIGLVVRFRRSASRRLLAASATARFLSASASSSALCCRSLSLKRSRSRFSYASLYYLSCSSCYSCNRFNSRNLCSSKYLSSYYRFLSRSSYSAIILSWRSLSYLIAFSCSIYNWRCLTLSSSISLARLFCSSTRRLFSYSWYLHIASWALLSFSSLWASKRWLSARCLSTSCSLSYCY